MDLTSSGQKDADLRSTMRHGFVVLLYASHRGPLLGKDQQQFRSKPDPQLAHRFHLAVFQTAMTDGFVDL